MHPTKNQKDLKMDFLKRQELDVNTKMTEILELSDKDFKLDIIKMLQYIIKTVNEEKKWKASTKT